MYGEGGVCMGSQCAYGEGGVCMWGGWSVYGELK